MPGRLFLTTPLADVSKILGVENTIGDSAPRRNIAPGQDIVVLQDTVLKPMRWGLIPVGRVNARGRPILETIINARSETVFDKSAFEGVGRGVVPVNGWYEWTGEKRRKQAWRLQAKDKSLLLFAAITDVWRAPGGKLVPQVATVTCEPNADVFPIHHRMGVLLRQKDVPIWLNGSEAEARALMKPFQNGALSIEEANDVDWDAV